ncbi:MAG: hypothetical protein QOH63_1661 [Acidobacteriota bacterium]|jgi:hypothetical protein|nr:hypothetical protein [Acidobacteriota bacterium]
MHDCRKLENRLVDLVFDEVRADEERPLLVEIENCADCLSEYRSMTETLLVFDQSFEAAMPDESYWPQHHAALRQRLEAFALPPKTKRDSFWKRLLMARLPLPVPVAAVIALALLTSSFLALRGSTVNIVPAAPQTASLSIAPPRIVEVPVVHEKVVTRTVYVEKRVRENSNARRQAPTPPTARDESALTASNSEKGRSFFTRVNLTDFQPPEEMKIRIIKRRSSDEN